jgi:hypothetical protein
VQVGAAHAAAADPDPDLTGTWFRHISFDPAQRTVVDMGAVVDRPGEHQTILAARRRALVVTTGSCSGVVGDQMVHRKAEEEGRTAVVRPTTTTQRGAS